jgi:hypothetical protein
MVSMTLSQFAAGALARRRIGFGDVRRLERDVLPAGLTCREDAEALLALDQAIRRADPAWAAYLATVIKDLALGPGGVLNRETADWLIEGPLREHTRTGLAIARAIVLEACEVDEVLADFVEAVRAKARSSRRDAPSPMVDIAPASADEPRTTGPSVADPRLGDQPEDDMSVATLAFCTDDAKL